MRSIFFLLLLAACSGCGQRETPTPNKWIDERLWPVLDAQDRRAKTELCAYLNDSSAIIREAAALAFASVQDSTSIPCMLKALDDAEPTVRAAVVFALGFVADSVTVVRMAQHALNERDSTLHRAYLSASFIAMQRNGMLKDPQAILHYLDRSTGHERVRAADALRRLPDSIVVKMAKEITDLMGTEEAAVRQFLILAMKKLGEHANKSLLERVALEGSSLGERVNALRTCGGIEGMSDDDLFFRALSERATARIAIDILRDRTSLDARRCLYYAHQVPDTSICYALLSLAMQHGQAATTDSAQKLLPNTRSPYLSEELIRARIETTKAIMLTLDEFQYFLGRDEHPVFRQACYQGALTIVRQRMASVLYPSREAQYAELSAVLDSAIRSGDPGLIASVAETLGGEEPDIIRMLLTPELEKQALAPLQPIRDLETRILIEKVIAKRDGLPPPSHRPPPFNHPIDQVKLRALPQGQRYRITTAKGEIIIATDVNDCPGSSLAFDSLVTAWYYNGKAFHRMVPNFVVQGGCPRGDGYGGMPWTLRTEIGRTPFTAGSVGLASAGRDTESCQFFITHSSTPHLDGRYTRFGEVVSGMDVVWMLQVGDVMERVERITH